MGVCAVLVDWFRGQPKKMLIMDEISGVSHVKSFMK